MIARCLAPRPEDRFASAAELAEALDSCRELRRVERDLPPGRMADAPGAAPARSWSPRCSCSLPQVLGSIVNISYNALRSINLSEAQQAAFPRVVLVYNIVVYPLCLFILFRQTAPVFRTWRRLSRPGPIDAGEVSQARRRRCSCRCGASAMACLGWLPGGVIFPLALDLTAGPVLPRVLRAVRLLLHHFRADRADLLGDCHRVRGGARALPGSVAGRSGSAADGAAGAAARGGAAGGDAIPGGADPAGGGDADAERRARGLHRGRVIPPSACW